VQDSWLLLTQYMLNHLFFCLQVELANGEAVLQESEEQFYHDQD